MGFGSRRVGRGGGFGGVFVGIGFLGRRLHGQVQWRYVHFKRKCKRVYRGRFYCIIGCCILGLGKLVIVDFIFGKTNSYSTPPSPINTTPRENIPFKSFPPVCILQSNSAAPHISYHLEREIERRLKNGSVAGLKNLRKPSRREDIHPA